MNPVRHIVESQLSSLFLISFFFFMLMVLYENHENQNSDNSRVCGGVKRDREVMKLRIKL